MYFPCSFKHSNTVWRDGGKTLIVESKFVAKNFDGKTREQKVTAIINYDGYVIATTIVDGDCFVH